MGECITTRLGREEGREGKKGVKLITHLYNKYESGLYTEILPRGGVFGVWKKEGGRKLCACEARHLGGSGGMLPRENFVIFSALSFNLVQTEGKYAVGKIRPEM